MSKPWNPRKPTVALKPSRIRRDPVRLEAKAEVVSEERELWGGITGVVLFAIALSALVIGISVATFSKYNAAAEARARQFGQCYNSGPNCVVDGGTIRVGGVKVTIAGIEAPRIQDAKCETERQQGIDAAVRLADLLNGGRVTVSAPFRDAAGREVRKVAVNGDDVGAALIAAELAREPGSDTPSWC